MSFDRGSSRTLTNAESLAKDSTSNSMTTASPRDVEAQPDLWLQSLSAPGANDNGKGRVNARIVSDAILGMSDGLTVPFALTAGLTVFNNARLVVLGGLAELVAGAISMGLGGYVGARSEVESYQATERRCETLISSSPAAAAQIIEDHFRQYGLSEEPRRAISEKVKGSPQSITCFLMRHHFDAAEPPDSRPYISALTLAISYFSGGFIPLIPYFAVAKNDVLTGLWISIGIMAVVLLVFGYVKTGVVRGWRGRENIWAAVKGAIQMLIVGAVAAGAAVGLVRAINHGAYVSG